MKKLLVVTAFLFGITLPAGAIPNQITYQGTLKQKGVPVTGTRNMRFRFVDAAGADLPGTAPINMANVSVTQGLFALQLPLDPKVNWQAYSPYIEIAVEGQVLSPNQPLSSNLYAMVAQTVADASVTTNKLADGAIATIKLADQIIISAKLANASVITSKVADGAITPPKMDTAAFTAPGVGLVPPGAILMFAGACPSGWTRFTALDDRFPMGSDTYGNRGGAATHSHSISADGSHSHSTGEMALTGGATGSGPTCYQTIGCPNWVPNYPGQTTSTAGSHSHGGTTATMSSLPPYMGIIFCQKQ